MSPWTKSYGFRNPLCAPSTRAEPCSVSVDTVTAADPATVRVLDADGTFAPSAAAEEYLPLIEALSDADLEQFYRDMVVIRAIDVQATNLQRQGQLALWPPSRGQGGCPGRIRPRGPPAGHFFLPIASTPSLGSAEWIRSTSPRSCEAPRTVAGIQRIRATATPASTRLVLGLQTLHATGLAMGLVFGMASAAPATSTATRP